MHIVIGGASGFVGPVLVAQLRRHGHKVTRLVRSGAAGNDTSRWNPAEHAVDADLIDNADAVINLGGAPIIRWPWTASYLREFEQSRIDCTATLARAIVRSSGKPAFISGSGMSYYGNDRGDELLTESSSAGRGTLAGVVQSWEAATQAAQEDGVRVCCLRTTNVVDASGGTLKLLIPIFRLGLGGPVSSGRQYFSLLSMRDWVNAVEFIATSPVPAGAYNLGSPVPATNAEFTATLAKALHRPAVVPVPAPLLKLATGVIADDLLGSLRITPAKLVDQGFEFADPDLAAVIAAALR